MSDPKTVERTVVHAVLTYTRPDGSTATALRGETVELTADELARAEKHGAVVDGPLPPAGPPAGRATPDEVARARAGVDEAAVVAAEGDGDRSGKTPGRSSSSGRGSGGGDDGAAGSGGGAGKASG